MEYRYTDISDRGAWLMVYCATLQMMERNVSMPEVIDSWAAKMADNALAGLKKRGL